MEAECALLVVQDDLVSVLLRTNTDKISRKLKRAKQDPTQEIGRKEKER